jgi:hypothetical protein
MLKLILTIFFTILLNSAVQADEKKLPTKVKVGMFITNIHDINFSDNEYQVEFWSWFLADNIEYNPSERTEITNAKQFLIRNASTQQINGQFLHSQVFKGTIKQHWDVSKYPFDKQRLIISLEDTLHTSDDLIYIIDETSSIANNIIPEGWALESFEVLPTSTNYPTTFGDPRLTNGNNYTFSQAKAVITLKRNGLRVFITSFLGLFVATFLIMIVFVINTSSKYLAIIPLQPRITLCVGSLFAAVGAIYGLDAKIPYTTSFTLSDSLQMTTFAGIIFAIISSVVSDVLIKAGKVIIQNNLMIAIWSLFLVLHIGLNTYLIIKSV